MSYVFGPVPSRRLGSSLGIDPVPLKTCNWNCVYCQLGRTVPVVHERRPWVSAREVVREVDHFLRRHPETPIDWVTFVGSGEPTLHSDLGWMIRRVRELTALPVAVITNGALLWKREVRRDLLPADAVMPTLDAGTAALYRRINRPHPELTFERLVDGLVALRREYTGKLWPEVMLVAGLNDSEEALEALAAVLRRLEPDEIHINLPIRPPAEPWVEPAGEEAVGRALAVLGEVARAVHPTRGVVDLAAAEDPVDAAVEVITRHPVSEEELRRALEHRVPGRVEETLLRLADDPRARRIRRYGHGFWTAAGSCFAAPRGIEIHAA
jgi:wyosine [tRNA(Phe)-imidazoG37] synthetase (radical SAM superfamily)